MKRRTLLAALAAMGLAPPRRGEAGGGPAAARPDPLAGDRLGRIGIQLYTLRDLVRRDFEGTLAALREIGFEEVEFAGYPEGTAASVRAMLARTGLEAPGAHVDLGRLRDAWPATLAFARDVGHRYVVLASLPPSARATLDDYRALAELLDRRGEEARREGLTLAYHNHDYELAPIDGVVPLQLLLERTAPEAVAGELDLYWVTRAGGDPAAWIERWPGRFPLLHVKDMDRTPARGFADLGQGSIDFARIFRSARRGRTRHFFYEQDRTPGPPLDSARAGYRYLRQLTF